MDKPYHQKSATSGDTLHERTRQGERSRVGSLTHVYTTDEFDASVEQVADGPTVALRHPKRLLGE